MARHPAELAKTAINQLLIRFNHWEGAFPTCPFIQLTTLDEHKDAKEVDIDKSPKP